MFKFECSECGVVHDGAPSFSFPMPSYCHDVPPEERARRTTLTSDLCTVDNEFYFIRTCLEIPIHGFDEPFTWGVWVSVSHANYQLYEQNFDDPEQAGNYFGWFNNLLPYYPNTLGLKTQAHVQRGGKRPLLELEPTDHPLSLDQRNGIAPDQAALIYARAMHRSPVS
jgi:hypothetical protein